MSMQNVLPPGWASIKMESIVEPTAPVMYGILQPGPNIDDGVPYVRPTEVENDVIQTDDLRRTTPEIANRYRRSMLCTDDVILSIVGTIGKVAVVPSEIAGANITQSSARIRVNPLAVCPRYMAWALRSPRLRQQFDKVRLGTAVPRLNIAHVRDLEIPVAPLPEQTRIVAKLDESFSDLDAGVAALERAQANLKRYRAAVLKAAVEGRLTEKWRAEHPDVEPADKLLARILTERRRRWEQDQLTKYEAAGKTPPENWQDKYKDPAAADTSSLRELPAGWCWAAFEQCAWEITVGHVGPMKNEYIDGGVPFLRSQNVRPLRYDREGLRFIDTEFDNRLSKSRLLGGELLVVRSGTIGDACVYPVDEPPANCADLVITRPLTGLDVRYAAIFVSSPVGRAFVSGKRTGSALTHFNVGAMKRSPFPLPPLSEQVAIVEEVERRISIMDSTAKNFERTLAHCSRLRHSILKRAFEGKLVPQDPADEPAAALLNRIRSSRENAAVAAHSPRTNNKSSRLRSAKSVT